MSIQTHPRLRNYLNHGHELYPDIDLDGGDTDDIAVKMDAEQQAKMLLGMSGSTAMATFYMGNLFPTNGCGGTPPLVWSLKCNRGTTVCHGTPLGRCDRLQQRDLPDGCPVSNWWQFTEPALKGKFYMEDPLADVSTTAKIAIFVEHADEMATLIRTFMERSGQLTKLIPVILRMLAICS